MPDAILSVSEFLRCHLLCRDPLIIISYGLPLAAPIHLSPFLADRTVYFLVGNWWSLLEPKGLAQTKEFYALLRDRYPRHHIVFLTNAHEESRVLEHLGMPQFFCHHNAFLDERLFTPMPEVAKTLDAVYTARLRPFKRHMLARHIPRWGLLYGFDPGEPQHQQAYLRYLRHNMPGMVCLNHDPATDAYTCFEPREMCRRLNAARVGLCLSAVEGGNYATTEYMLCGLPVVSTASQGGRDYFLDPQCSRVVAADTFAVARAVAELIAEDIPPARIRQRTLEKMHALREDFIRLVAAILSQEGKNEDFAARFATVFTHKMLTYPGTPEKFLAENGLLPTGGEPKDRETSS